MRSGNQNTSNRKLLILVENLSVPFDRRVWRECLAMREAGYQVSVISPKGDDIDTAAREKRDGVSIYRYSLYQSTGGVLSYILEYGIALVMTMRLMFVVYFREGFDVIQLCNPPDLLILVALPFKLIGKKVIFDQHDLSPEIYEAHRKGVKGKLVYKLLLFFERMTYRFSDVVIATNDSFKEVARVRGGKKEEDIFIVRNGPTTEQMRKAKPDPALRSKAKHLISYVGMMGPQDGIDILLRSIQHLMTSFKRNDFHVYLMGGGSVFDDMRRSAKELGIDHVVTFAGRVGYEQVMNGISSADLCVCPDPMTAMNDKSTLVKIIEYMGAGRPVVAFDLSESRKSAGDAAIYARPNDPRHLAEMINFLLDSPLLRDTMGQIGRKRVESTLAWEHSKRSLYAAYEKAFSRDARNVQKMRCDF